MCIGTRLCFRTVGLEPPDILAVAKSHSLMVLVQMEFRVSMRFVHLIRYVRVQDVRPCLCSGLHIRDGKLIPAL
jgi:hypothetical protein